MTKAIGRGGALLAVFLSVGAVLPGAHADLLGRSSADENLAAGRAALEDGFHDLAARKFRAYIDETFFRNNKARGSTLLARALLLQGKADEAASWLVEHREWAEGGSREPGYTYWTAFALLESGRADAALALLEPFERKYAGDSVLPLAERLHIRTLLRLGRKDEALARFAAFGTKYPQAREQAENLLDWARVLLEEERADEAQPILLDLIEKHADVPQVHTARLWLGRLWMDRGRPVDAEAVLDLLARNAGADADLRAQAWLLRGRIAEAAGQSAAALEAYALGEAAARDAEHRLVGRISRARLMARTGQDVAAATLLEEAVRGAPAHPRAGDAQLELAAILLERGDAAGALSAYQSYLEVFADEAGQARAQLGKGWCLWRLARHAEAAHAFEKAAALLADPVQRETALVKAADAYFANAQFKLADEAYQRALAEYPSGAQAAQALFQSAECQSSLREPGRAAVLLARLRERFPDHPLAARAALRLAALHEEQGQWEDAGALYNQFLAAAPPALQPEILFRSAVALYRGGRFAEAHARFEKILAEHPGTPWAEQAFYLRGWALHLMGETRRGLQVARQFLELHPDSAWAPDVLFWLGEQQFNGGQFKEAESTFRDLAARFPAHAHAPSALYWAGRSAAAQTEYRRAMALYTELSRTYTNSPLLPEVRFAQGDALSELGEFSGAILAFDDIIRNYPSSPLVDRARGRRGDCQFTLGADRPERYQEALASFRSLLDSPTASPSLKLQAEFKSGRSYEKMGRRAEAFEYYMNVVYGWLGLRDRGQFAEPVWFARAAFAAAAIKEADQQWAEALRIYERVQAAGIPAGADAVKRIERIRAERAAPAG